jgi:hypothetical protein
MEEERRYEKKTYLQSVPPESSHPSIIPANKIKKKKEELEKEKNKEMKEGRENYTYPSSLPHILYSILQISRRKLL